ncbi:heavy-metal-associated domain-containing protein [Bdellovibrio bacteriovorus]|uniref:Putative cation-transporting ATPase n=1 Tax=Bdellovibrio bacteriovorus str. Tiberius TaxID=1069642 RepID=K7YML2_BDEBC|nr:heavy metal-associated domain-containing protein [Bdellovibrio bacteriovorus]AFY01021.1 putative cation-transporting ATPase [Bdellovibrio bacteriovorus str. Tiberius]
MKKLLAVTALLLCQTALAETITYEVEGMHCTSCARSIKAQVCKMDGLEKCDVTVGKVIVSPKAGSTISQDQIQAAISKAGEYKIINSSKSK